MRNNWFLQGLITNSVYALLALIGGGLLTFLSRRSSEWTVPLLYGLAAFVMISVGTLALKTIGKLRKNRLITDPENVESSVRSWLNNFRYAIQNAPDPAAYFRLGVTTDSGVRMTIGRAREAFDDYIVVRSDVHPSPEDAAMLQHIPANEVNRIVLQVRLELARARMGYTGLALPLPPGGFWIFRRVPINDSLTEDKLLTPA